MKTSIALTKTNQQLSLMGKHSIFLFGLTLFSILFFQSCAKDETQLTNNSNSLGIEGLIYENGYLNFTTEDAFQEAVTFLKEHQNNPEIFTRAFPGFISAAKQYELDLERFDNEVKCSDDVKKFPSMALRTINNETEVVPTVDAILLSYLVNNKRILQMEDNIYHFTYDKTYTIPFKSVRKSKNGLVFDTDDATEVYTNVRTIGGDQFEISDRSAIDEFTYNYYTCTIDRRFYGSMETTDVGVYMEIKLVSKHQKKSVGIWNAEKAQYIGTTGSGKFTGPFAEDPTQYSYNVDINKFDANDANHVISALGGLGGGDHYYFVAGQCNHTHDFKRDCAGTLYWNFTNY